MPRCAAHTCVCIAILDILCSKDLRDPKLYLPGRSVHPLLGHPAGSSLVAGGIPRVLKGMGARPGIGGPVGVPGDSFSLRVGKQELSRYPEPHTSCMEGVIV